MEKRKQNGKMEKEERKGDTKHTEATASSNPRERKRDETAQGQKIIELIYQ